MTVRTVRPTVGREDSKKPLSYAAVVEILVDVLHAVVEPAVRSVFAGDEVTALELSDAPDGGFTLRLVAGGETYQDWVVQAGVDARFPDDWRERLRSSLVDFVAESGFGWGQNREDGPPR